MQRVDDRDEEAILFFGQEKSHDVLCSDECVFVKIQQMVVSLKDVTGHSVGVRSN